MKKNQYTIRTLMARMGMTHAGAASLIRRMRKHGFAEFVETITLGGPTSKNKAFVYELLVDPEEYLRGTRSTMVKIPKSGFYNNPFNLKEAKNERHTR
jgi:hypothetical protein